MSGGQVGIFLAVPDAGAQRLITRMTSLAAAEVCGDFLTHPEGHADVWDAWQALGSAGLARHGLPAAVAACEYEDFPRGRVVFHRPQRRFIAYADRRLHGPAITRRILTAFGLPGDTCLQADEHYRTNRTLSGDAT